MPNIPEQIQLMIDNLRENQEIEVKNWLDCLSTRDAQAKLAKEIMALANHGGGYVFIGFEDDEPHASIAAPDNWEEAFSQDAIAGVVERYISPPCQCAVHILERDGEDIPHPVIVVPGNHRTPLFANRGSPEGEDAFQATDVFIRRPGGKSEKARTQDDWEKLIDRLVRARSNELVDAMRAVLNPDEVIDTDNPDIDLETWIADALARWNELLDGADAAADDDRRFNQGYWHIAFGISSFAVDDLSSLSTFMDRETSKFSGWPPFTFLHRDPVRPYPNGDNIEAWIGADDNTLYADFWRISKDGFGFMVRGFQEDEDGYGSNVSPGPPIPVFDWVLPIYRMAEVLLYLEGLAERFADDDASFELQVTYCNTSGRTLWQHSLRYTLFNGAECRSDSISSGVSANVSDISPNLNEIVFQLLKPIYAQFNFTELPERLVDNVLQEVLSSQSR